jgi:hypothetical protein
MTDEIVKQNESQIMEGVLLGGDLSKLSPAQRVTYYQRVCESMGLNPLTKPFSYLQLNGKLTLYALKDAADQLRKINGVSIDDVDVVETDTQFLVKVKGHDKTGRADVEIGVVSKKDMQGKQENVQMKAVTKAKRRLALSLCGLGMLDETEIETIPGARPVDIAETGEISEGKPTQHEMTIEDARQVIVKGTSGAEKFMSELTAEQLHAVIEKSSKPEQVEAAKIVLKHDFQME